jgi:serine/threonine protein kinase
VLCYRCGGHVKDGSEKCSSCGQQFAPGLKPGPIAGFGAGSRRHRLAVEGAPCKPGDAIAGRFVIKEGLGAGPLGWVFRAADQQTGELVALKILSPRFLQLPEERQAFSAQLQQAASLDHPNAAQVIAAGLDGDKPWIASALLEGMTLRRIMELRRQKGQAFALHEIEPIAAQIAAALEAAPFAHGDLKPDNVLVLPDLLKLTDFALGLCLPRVPFVAAQRAAGTQRYLSPELLSGERPDGRADVYALGVMVAEMLAGAAYEPGLELKSKGMLPEGVENLVVRAVAPRAGDRFVTAAQFVAELSEALGGPAAPREDDVDIEQSQTDPRVRIARALAAQDEEEAASKGLRPGQEPPSPTSPVQLPLVTVHAAGSPSLATASSTAVTNPKAVAPAQPQEPAAAAGPQPTGDEPTIQLTSVPQPTEWPALPPLAPLAPLEPLAALPPLSVPPPLSMPPQPQPSGDTGARQNPLTVAARAAPTQEEIARVAASVGATPELLTAETAVRAAPTAPPAALKPAPVAPVEPAPVETPAAAPALPLAAAPAAPAPAPVAEPARSPAPAGAAPLAAQPASQPDAAPPPGAADEDDSGESDAGPKGRKRGRGGKRGRREERKAEKVARRSSSDPEWAAGGGTSAPAPSGGGATALGAETPAFQPLPAASVEEVAKALGVPAAPASVAGPASEPAPAVVTAPVPEAGPAFEMGSLPPAPKSRPAAPRATPSFGAIAEEKKAPLPLIVLGAAVVIGLLAFAYSRVSGDEKPAQERAAAVAPKAAEAPKPVEPPKAAEPPKAPEAAPEKPVEAKAAPVEKPAPAPAKAEKVAKAEKFDPPAKGSGKKSFVERLRERREARLRAQEDALAEAAAKRSAAAAAKAAAPAPAPAPAKSAPAPAPVAAAPAPVAAPAPPPPSPAIPGLDDSDTLVASKTPKKLAALAPAPTITVNDASCPTGMKLIPGGVAHVGTDAADDLRNFGDRSASTVDLKAFCIDLFEYPNKPGQLPKLAAAFSEADASCKREGKRLCSEDEWEKSCRGPQNLRFPYGPNFDADLCNTQDKNTNPRKVTVVGIFGGCKSGYGVFDLSGNAAEWTASSFEGGGADKAVKGGSATRPGFDDRCSSRRRVAPGAHDVNVGFRCCSEAK